jgi:hypothetical protein
VADGLDHYRRSFRDAHDAVKRQQARLTRKDARELLALVAEQLSVLESVETEHAELLAAAKKAKALARTIDGSEWSRKLDAFAADIASTVAKEVATLKKTSEAKLAQVNGLLSR